MLLWFRVRSCSDPSVVLKNLLLTFLLLLLWRTPPFFMQKISNIDENVQILAADLPEMKIYIKSRLKSDRFRMYTKYFRISRNVCLFFIFGKFSKPTRAGDVKRSFFQDGLMILHYQDSKNPLKNQQVLQDSEGLASPTPLMAAVKSCLRSHFKRPKTFRI